MFRAVPPIAVALCLLSCAVGAPTDAAPPPAEPRSTAVRPRVELDLGSMMRRVHFAFAARGDAYHGGDATYAVDAGRDGAFRFAPIGHERSPGAPLSLGPARLTTAREPIAIRGPARVASDGSVVRGVDVQEQLANRAEGTELSWTFPSAPGGAVEVALPVAGLALAATTGTGLHFRDEATGLGVRVGHGTWIDAAGIRTPIAARYEDGAVRFDVSAELALGSTYPATLDPLVGPEIGLDDPIPAPPSTNQQGPRVAFAAGEYLVVWQDSRGADLDIWGARVSDAGVLLDPGGIHISSALGDQTWPAVAHDGTSFVVTWQDQRAGNWDIYGARVTAAGAVLDPDGFAISAATGDQTAPQIAAVAGTSIVTWQDLRTANYLAYAGRVSGGAALDGDGFAVSSSFAESPTIGTDGTGFLVAYANYPSNVASVSATRLSAAGQVLDPNGVVLAAASPNSVAIAYGGGEYLVAWDAYTSSATAVDVYAIRVDGSAAAIGGPILVCGAAKYQQHPVVDFDGSQFLVAWADQRGQTTGGGYDVRASRVSIGGSVLDGSGFLVSSSVSDNRPWGAASDGQSSFIAVQDGRNYGSFTYNLATYGVRVSQGAQVLDANGILVGQTVNAESAMATAFDGTNYLVVWQDARNGVDYDIYAARVAPDGTVLDAAAIPLCTAAGDQTQPSVVFDGTNYLAAWMDARAGTANLHVYGTRITPGGAVLDASGLPIATAAPVGSAPTLAANGSSVLVVWSDARGGQYNAWGARIARSGASLDGSGVQLVSRPTSQQGPRLSFDGTNYLLVWAEYNAGNHVFGARISPALASLGASGIAIGSGAPTDQYAPRVAFGAGGYLVTWYLYSYPQPDQVYARRVALDGTLPDASALQLASAASSPDVAFDGHAFMVAWSDFRAGATGSDVYATRVLPGGTVVDASGFPIATDRSVESSPALTSNGVGVTLVAYARGDTSPGYGASRARARFVTELPQGTACSSAAQCLTGFCVDGVCCDGPCGGGVAGDCQACSVLAGGTQDGTCSALAAPNAVVCRPASDLCDAPETCQAGSKLCPPDTVSAAGKVCRAAVGVCDVAEACDGTNAACPADGFAMAGIPCRAIAGPCDVAETCTGAGPNCPVDGFVVAGTACSGPSCAAGLGTPAASCSGSDAACPSAVSASCGDYVCGATSCLTTCLSAADCASGRFCDATQACEPLFAGSVSCTGAFECASGFCVDGVCCDGACDGQCEACSVPGSLGICTTVTSGPPLSGRPACAGTGACQGSCTGASATTCGYPDATTTCGAGSCSSGTAVSASTCDGNGACAPGEPTACGSYACGAGACKTSCASDADCAAGYVCGMSGACESAPADAGVDATADAGEDASVDAGEDAGEDAGVDAGVDAGPRATEAPRGSCACEEAGRPTRGSNAGLTLAIFGLGLGVVRRRRIRRAIARSPE
jgi:hypothetical protein